MQAKTLQNTRECALDIRSTQNTQMQLRKAVGGERVHPAQFMFSADERDVVALPFVSATLPSKEALRGNSAPKWKHKQSDFWCKLCQCLEHTGQICAIHCKFVVIDIVLYHNFF